MAEVCLIIIMLGIASSAIRQVCLLVPYMGFIYTGENPGYAAVTPPCKVAYISATQGNFREIKANV